VLNVESVLQLMERQAREAGIAVCPLNGSLYAKMNRATDEVFWIRSGHRSTRDEVERVLRQASGFAPEVAFSYKVKGG
jgi:hypothetical protein